MSFVKLNKYKINRYKGSYKGSKLFFRRPRTIEVNAEGSSGDIQILKSPTGSGKTYSLVMAAIKEAALGGIVVVCFPNLNLLNENINFLKLNLGEEKNVDVLELSLNEYGTRTGIKGPEDLLNKLKKGRLIIMTLHSYISQRGDYGNYSSFFMLLQAFKHITSIYVDEGHIFFDRYHRTYNLNHLVSFEKGQYRIIKSGRNLEDLIKNKQSIFITPQIQISEKITSGGRGANLGYQLKSPREVYIPQLGLDFVESEELNKSYSMMPKEKISKPDNEEIQSSNKYELTNIETLALSKETISYLENIRISNGHFLIEKLKVMTGEYLSLHNIYYDLFFLSITGDVEKDTEIKNFLSTFYKKLFNYNSYIQIMNAHNIKNFREAIRIALEKRSNRFDLLELKKQIISLNVDFVSDTMKLLKTNYEDEKVVRDNFFEIIANISVDFIEILMKNEPSELPIKEIYPENELEALSMSYILSRNTVLLNHKSVLYKRNVTKDGTEVEIQTMDNFENYKESILRNKEEKMKKEKIKEEAALEEQSAVEAALEGQSAVEAALEGQSAVEAALEGQSAVEESEDNKEKSTSYMSYTTNTPFTSDFSCFYLGDWIHYKDFKKMLFFSATYSTATLDTLKNAVQGIKFYSFPTKQEELDELVIMRSDIDWFSNSKADWRDNWNSFSYFFYNNFVKEKENLKKFALFLTPSNRDAEYFYKCKLKPNQNYSLVLGSDESYLGFSKDTSFSEKFSFNTKPTDIENICIRISSILSTIAVGLNMPEHFFIIAAANSFKPVSIAWKYGNISIVDIRNYETILALVQAIGRNARRSKYEIETSSYTSRCLLVSKSNTFPNTIDTLGQYSSQFYKNVNVFDMTPIENLLNKQLRGKDIRKDYFNFKFLEKKYPLIYSNLFPFSDWENVQDIRFNMLKEVLILSNEPVDKDSAQNKKVKYSKLRIVYYNFLNRIRILSFCAHLVNKLSNNVLEILKNPSLILEQKENKKLKVNIQQEEVTQALDNQEEVTQALDNQEEVTQALGNQEEVTQALDKQKEVIDPEIIKYIEKVENKEKKKLAKKAKKSFPEFSRIEAFRRFNVDRWSEEEKSDCFFIAKEFEDFFNAVLCEEVRFKERFSQIDDIELSNINLELKSIIDKYDSISKPLSEEVKKKMEEEISILNLKYLELIFASIFFERFYGLVSNWINFSYELEEEKIKREQEDSPKIDINRFTSIYSGDTFFN